MIIWDLIKSTRDCFKANHAEYCNGDLATVQFSLDIAELKFAELSGNQLPVKIKGLIGLRISKTYKKG